MSASSSPPSQNALPRVGDVCADDADVLALSVVRFVAAGYTTSDVACWDAAFDGAERLLGSDEGARFVSSLIGLVRALRAEREGDWSFMPATCCRVTGHECALVRLIGRGRCCRWDEVMRGAAEITGQLEAPRLVSALRSAVTAIDAAAERLAVPPQPVAPAVLH